MLVADAFMEACSTVMPQGADAAGGAHDSNTPSKVEGSCGQSAVIDHKQQRKPKKEKQYKVTLRGGKQVRQCSSKVRWMSWPGMVAHTLCWLLSSNLACSTSAPCKVPCGVLCRNQH